MIAKSTWVRSRLFRTRMTVLTITIAVDAATTRFIASSARSGGVRQNTRTPRVSRSTNGAAAVDLIAGRVVESTSVAEPTKPSAVPTNREW